MEFTTCTAVIELTGEGLCYCSFNNQLKTGTQAIPPCDNDAAQEANGLDNVNLLPRFRARSSIEAEPAKAD